MARGGLVNSDGLCVAVITAANGLQLQYARQADGSWLSFVPDLFANVGDTWNGSVWAYSTATPPPVTINQLVEAFAFAGFLPQLQAAIAALTGTSKNAWSNSITITDPTIIALGAQLGLTAQQGKSVLQFAATLPP